MMPSIYGYVRALPDTGIDEVLSAHGALRRFALTQGFDLADVFVESRPQARTVWNELLVRCRRKGVRTLAVFSSEHLDDSLAVAQRMRAEAEATIGGRLWVVCEQSDPTWAFGPGYVTPDWSATSKLRLAAQTRAVPRARHHTRDVLQRWRLDREDAETAELVVTELVTNAVQHAQHPGPCPESLPISLTLTTWPQYLLIEVHDPHPGLPQLPYATPPDSECGRGLILVDAAATRWGMSSRRSGKSTWCLTTVQ